MFEEKVGIITGGTSGIGLATAELLAKEGMHVVIASRNSEKGEEALSSIKKVVSSLSFYQNGCNE